jgi:hypothetical protein
MPYTTYIFPIKKILNIDKYFVCESRDMSDESGTYIILLKLKTKHIFLVLILPTKSMFKNLKIMRIQHT